MQEHQLEMQKFRHGNYEHFADRSEYSNMETMNNKEEFDFINSAFPKH